MYFKSTHTKECHLPAWAERLHCIHGPIVTTDEKNIKRNLIIFYHALNFRWISPKMLCYFLRFVLYFFMKAVTLHIYNPFYARLPPFGTKLSKINISKFFLAALKSSSLLMVHATAVLRYKLWHSLLESFFASLWLYATKSGFARKFRSRFSNIKYSAPFSSLLVQKASDSCPRMIWGWLRRYQTKASGLKDSIQ